ncbi:MAG: hypothetical protein WAM14_21555 [Candidatus Nitrosopolaris sp.]
MRDPIESSGSAFSFHFQVRMPLKHSANDLIDVYSDMNPALKSCSDMLASFCQVEPSIWKDLFIDGWYIPATAEARRRYYSAMHFLRTVGSFNVATGIYNPFALTLNFLSHNTFTMSISLAHFSLQLVLRIHKKLTCTRDARDNLVV